ncbi:uncharacterized protein LOC126842398 [Adelges cooleyi]|uniref:uncharacterized protein LOC126842398 n=1 Tax=Adelges cooleyi TaxID=133065 RepID=UPI00217F2439|nr:uncharacterized protein LOC126842398 [Adelges cooleyi]XP_050435354.1 uncharacterized protein LOC126842398 [Adelges cooleyi]XP_050435355.1 uncharacterized protein LOC126842398 [Adelges cooleyi]XP_050435356.1 uncharacterized protein LOC126842398 [Adelges cooleyi]
MKLLSILITITFVNVSPIMTGEYANSVKKTNKHIREASIKNPKGLETVISNIINGDKTFETLNFMLAIPDKANFRFTIQHEESFITNLPENIAIADQKAVQEAIFQVTGIPVPNLRCNENYENDRRTLSWLGDSRRMYLSFVTQNVLTDAIDKGTPGFTNLKEICILIGLLRSMRFPDSYIKIARVDQDDNVCMLISQNGRFHYKPYDGYIAAARPMGRPVYNEHEDVLNEAMRWFH